MIALIFNDKQHNNHEESEKSQKCTWQRLKALPGEDIPDLDSGVGIARHQDVVSQLHPGGQALNMTRVSIFDIFCSLGHPG